MVLISMKESANIISESIFYSPSVWENESVENMKSNQGTFKKPKSKKRNGISFLSIIFLDSVSDLDFKIGIWFEGVKRIKSYGHG